MRIKDEKQEETANTKSQEGMGRENAKKAGYKEKTQEAIRKK